MCLYVRNLRIDEGRKLQNIKGAKVRLRRTKTWKECNDPALKSKKTYGGKVRLSSKTSSWARYAAGLRRGQRVAQV